MHDPARHIEYLRQSLSRDKAPIGFFISAGCPVSVRVSDGDEDAPLIPDVRGMTEHVERKLAKDEDLEQAFAKLQACFAEGSEPNIEDLLSRVRALLVVVGSGKVHGLDETELQALETGLVRAIAGLASAELPPSATAYRHLAAWAGAVPRNVPVEIFTTNYDLLMEQALERVRVPYFDGFVGSHQPFFDVAAIEQDEIPSRWVRVWKLHGSVNWRQEPGGVVSRVSGAGDQAQVLIHPSHLKYDQSRRMPYLAMIDRLRAFLRQKGASLVICGYSFGDDHLNEVLLQGLQGNPTASAFGLLYGKLDAYDEAVRLASHRSNLSLLAADAAVVGTLQADWNPASVADVPAAPGPSGHGFPHGDFAAFGELLAEMIGVSGATESSDGA